MPIAYQIDPDKHQIVATATGILNKRDLFAYQDGIASQPALAGYDEIFDATQVEGLVDIDLDSLKKLARVAASSDVADKFSKFVIVAARDLHFGLGRMYESFRECVPQSNRELAAFHSREEAERWLEAKEECLPAGRGQRP